MCMHKVSFSLKSDGKGGYFGVGYKHMPRNNRTAKNPAGFRLGRWTKDKYTGTISSNDYKQYAAGFHLFLSLEDANSYGNGNDIYEIHFRNVVAFGTNETYRTASKTGPCVIAREIKPVKKIA